VDRIIVLPGQIPLVSDILDTNKAAMVGVGKLLQAVFGSSTLLHGFACTPTSPASLEVNVAAGQVFSLQNIDATPYGSLAADVLHQIVKQGLILDATELECPAPGTVGHSINYLVQIAFTETDTDPTVRTYYNAANPSEPWMGPNNNSVPDATRRKAQALVQVKAGVAATTGSQTTPAPDAGFIGAWVVTVDQGQTQINSGDIALYAGAPFITETLQDKIGQSSGDARYVPKAGGTMTGPLTLPGNPANPLEAAPKQYVDSLAAGIQIKEQVAVATTANVALTGEQTIDGVLTSASRILVKNQTAPAENGVWVTAAGAWARAGDMDAWAEFPGAMVLVAGGDTQSGSSWLCSSAPGGTLNTTAVTFEAFANAGSYQVASALLGAISALSTAGIIVRAGPGAALVRSIVAGAGIAVTNGNGVDGDPSIAVDKASAAQFRAGTASKMLDPKAVFDAAASVDLASSGAIVVDMAAGFNFKATLNGSATFNAPANVRDGQSGKIEIRQDAIGGKTATWHTNWEFAGGVVPTLSVGANAKDVITFIGLSDGKVLAAMNKDVRR